MGKRGPRSSGSMHVIEPAEKRRPNPQPGMSKNARTIWLRIVKSLHPDHFKPYQYDLLRLYCEASNSHKNAIVNIREQGEVITQENGVTKGNPWVDVAIKMSSQMATLSTKLGLNVNNTMVNRGKVKPSSEPKSKRDDLLFGGRKK